MNFSKDPQVNWKYVLIVVILATIVGGGILVYQYWWIPKEEIKIPEIKSPEEVAKDETASWKTYHNEWYEIKYPDFFEEKIIFGGGGRQEIYFPTSSIVPDYYPSPDFKNGVIIKPVNKLNNIPLDFEAIDGIEGLEAALKNITKGINVNIERVNLGKEQAIKLSDFELTEKEANFPQKYCASSYFVASGHDINVPDVVVSFLTIDECVGNQKSEYTQNLFNQILSTFNFLK